MSEQGQPLRRREPRQVRSRETVERLLDAGLAVLLERGWDGATTNHIAAAAGTSPGSLYQYFHDKSDVLDRVVHREMERLEARVSRTFVAALGGPLDPDRVRAVVDGLLDAFAEHPGLLRVLADRVPRGVGGRRAAFARRVDELVVAALVGGGGGGGCSVEVQAWVLVRTVEHVTTSYVLEEPGLDRDAVVEELTRLVWRSLRPDPEPGGGARSVP